MRRYFCNESRRGLARVIMGGNRYLSLSNVRALLSEAAQDIKIEGELSNDASWAATKAHPKTLATALQSSNRIIIKP